MAIRERKQSYGVRVHLGGGRYKWVGSFPFVAYGGKREALKAAKNAEAEATVRIARRKVERETCDSFARRWIDDYPRASAATRQTYSYALRAFIDEYKGVHLDALDRAWVRRWAVKQPKSNIEVLRAMFNDALEDELVDFNPFEKMGKARRKAGGNIGNKKQIWVPTIPQLHDLGQAALDHHGPDSYGPTARAYVMFLAYSGMRPGEVAVLEQGDIDRAAEEIHVVRILNGAGEVQDYTKNGRQRTIALLNGAKDALDGLPVHIGRTGEGGTPRLFSGPNGAVLGKGPRHNVWNPIRAAYGRPKMRAYDLRHFCATYLLERGASDLDVSVQLGHTDGGALVRSTYGHAERSSLARLRALDSEQVTPLRDANETHPDQESA